MMRRLVLLLLITMLLALASGLRAEPGPKVLVLGFDGMDPNLLQDFLDEGLLPNFQRFLDRGAQFQPLGTSIPPQSPVAWSCFTAGTDPGGTGIFDFIHRDPETMLPYLSTSSAQAPGAHWKLGKWKIPRGGGTIENLRQGRAFWQELDQAGIDVTVFKVPANFPPVECEARTLSGMGTPDIQGTYGIFRYITDDPNVNTVLDGGTVDPVFVRDGRVETTIEGPINSYREGDPNSEIPLTVTVDKENRSALFEIEGDRFLLEEGEWSDWVDLRFEMVPLFKDVAGICRFYLLETTPHFRLYVTPVQIHPVHPEMPISTPDDYSRQLAEDTGLFYTQGLPEDSAALEAGVLSDSQYACQSDQILAERQRQFRYELAHFAPLDSGFLFFYFNSPDQSCHVFWRSFDEQSPTHAAADPAFRFRVQGLYEALDESLGQALDALSDDAVIMIISDHGFAPFRRSLNVNTWLLENGYLALRDDMAREDMELLVGFDWEKTRAYAVGINGLYLNLKGRERDGIVEPGAEAEALLDELVRKLESTVDPETGQHPIKYAYRADKVYSSAYRDRGPDIILGYHSGWRGSNESALGQVPEPVFMDNLMKWSGDHCMAADVVPGVVLTSRPFSQPDPALVDMGPTILKMFGLQPPASMTGRDLYAPLKP
jgi:predicted AlkP superfamily phosphohydrolase/phosphomutase